MAEIEKFDSRVHGELIKQARFSYATCPPMMDRHGYVLHVNGEPILVWQSIESPNRFPAIHTPAKKENWENVSISFATKDDIEKIKQENIPVLREEYDVTDYFYRTGDFLEPSGRFGKKARRFEKQFKPTVSQTCDRVEIEKFYEQWFAERVSRLGTEWSEGMRSYDRDFFQFCLDRLDQYSIRQIYVRVDGKLAAMAWGCVHSPGKWVGLHVKVDRQYDDISRFLQQERAKLFSDCPELTLGTSAGDQGVAKMKLMLNPIREEAYYVVQTGKKPPTTL